MADREKIETVLAGVTEIARLQAWACTDARHPYIRGIVTTSRETVEAWREGGIEFVALVPEGRYPADAAHAWRVGEPPHPWKEEWFIAETTIGDRVVLKALPKEHTYDYKTADETYIKADKIKRWMQFPDSEYIAPGQDHSPADVDRGAQHEIMMRVFDWAYLHATEGTAWPDRCTAERAIELAKDRAPTQADADTIKATSRLPVQAGK